MNVMKQQIKKMFANLKELKEDGIWFDGERLEGEYKQWRDNGRLWFHSFYEQEKLRGEFKGWWDNGQLFKHCFYIDDYKYKGEYKEWNYSGKLKEYKIYNDDGTLKERIL